MEKCVYVARSTYGDKVRTSSRVYTHCVVRADGWCMFSQTRAAAERELRYQTARGRAVELVAVQLEHEVLKDPAAVALGRRGGRVRSEAKTAAARANGAQGGRPPNPRPR